MREVEGKGMTSVLLMESFIGILLFPMVGEDGKKLMTGLRSNT